MFIDLIQNDSSHKILFQVPENDDLSLFVDLAWILVLFSL